MSVEVDDENKIEEVFNKLAEGGKVTMPLAKQFWGATFGMLQDKFGVNWMFNHEDKKKLNKIKLIYELRCKKVLLEKDKVEGIRFYETYRREGGYKSVEKAFKMSPADIVEEVKKSGLRGRGGAGFPTGMKWSFIAKPEGVPRHLVCNADESEPGTFKDRYLMEFLPHLLIEGLIVSSFALGSNVTYIYIRGEYAWIVDILEQAIDEAKNNGWLGKNILGSWFRL